MKERSMDEVEKLFIITALFKQTIIPINGQKPQLRQTIRLIKAKDAAGAKEKFNAFWHDKMRSFSIVSAELTEEI